MPTRITSRSWIVMGIRCIALLSTIRSGRTLRLSWITTRSTSSHMPHPTLVRLLMIEIAKSASTTPSAPRSSSPWSRIGRSISQGADSISSVC